MHKKLNISDIGYGFFTKSWCLSIDNNASLNCSHNTDDDQNVVNKNINIYIYIYIYICPRFGKPEPEHIVDIHQISKSCRKITLTSNST